MARTDNIDYVTIASTGNATDFGDSPTNVDQSAACASNTKGLYGGGYISSNTSRIEVITFASRGNATNFGDLSQARRATGSASSNVRGVWAGGGETTIDYVTITSEGTASDFGDLAGSYIELAGCSNAHGGIEA